MDQSFSDLLKMDKCSPLMVYGVIVVITGICIYNVRSEFSKLGNNSKVQNTSDMFMWYEISLLLVTGVLMFGLCQYNESALAWSVLFAPLVAYTLKTVIVFMSVSNIQKMIPTNNLINNANLNSNSAAIQQVLNNTMRQQSAIQTPQQIVMPSQKLGTNAGPASISPPLNKASSIGGLGDSMLF